MRETYEEFVRLARRYNCQARFADMPKLGRRTARQGKGVPAEKRPSLMAGIFLILTNRNDVQAFHRHHDGGPVQLSKIKPSELSEGSLPPWSKRLTSFQLGELSQRPTSFDLFMDETCQNPASR